MCVRNRADAEVTLLNPDMLGINDDILDIQIGLNTNLDDADDGDADHVSRRRKLARCVSDSSVVDARPARKSAGARSTGSGGAARATKPPTVVGAAGVSASLAGTVSKDSV